MAKYEVKAFPLYHVILGNLPFILIQRYNRPRLLRLLAHTENKESQQR